MIYSVSDSATYLRDFLSANKKCTIWKDALNTLFYVGTRRVGVILYKPAV